LSRSKYDANGAATEDERVRHVSVLAVVLHVSVECAIIENPLMPRL
jgi:hypothetical protein